MRDKPSFLRDLRKSCTRTSQGKDFFAVLFRESWWWQWRFLGISRKKAKQCANSLGLELQRIPRRHLEGSGLLASRSFSAGTQFDRYLMQLADTKRLRQEVFFLWCFAALSFAAVKVMFNSYLRVGNGCVILQPDGINASVHRASNIFKKTSNAMDCFRPHQVFDNPVKT